VKRTPDDGIAVARRVNLFSAMTPEASHNYALCGKSATGYRLKERLQLTL
jgi:hypothetical protein